MYSFRCECGKVTGLTDVNLCPICHRYMGNKSDELIRKHVVGCRDEVKHSSRGRGRPKHEDEEEILPVLHRICATCGTRNCVGKENSEQCEEWTPRPLESCPLCHRRPQERWVNGLLTEIECGHCKLSMKSYNIRNGSLILIEMWNNRC